MMEMKSVNYTILFFHCVGNLMLGAEKAIGVWGLAVLAFSATKLSLLKSNGIDGKIERA